MLLLNLNACFIFLEDKKEKTESTSQLASELISRLALAPAQDMNKEPEVPVSSYTPPTWHSYGIQAAPTAMPPTRTERTLTPTQLRRRDCSTQTDILPKRRSLRWRHEGCVAARCRFRRQLDPPLPQPPGPPPPRAVRQSDRETAVQRRLRMQLLLRAATSQRTTTNRYQ